jgi:uncharacterized membrane protein
MSKTYGNGDAGLDIGVRQIAIAGILTAMTVVMTVFTKIPISATQGYFNLGDTVVLTAGVLLGSFTGAFAGAVGSAAADIFSGGYIFAPITLIVKGVEGYVAGRVSGGGLVNDDAAKGFLARGGIYRRIPSGKPGRRLLMPALIAGACAMVIGYFLAEATVLALFDRAFGLAAAIAELPFNMAQGGISIALSRLAIEGLRRSKII